MHVNHKSGFSLIEVMVAALILVVLVIGGGALMYHAGGNIKVMGNKHLAMERAMSKLESYRSRDYFDLRAAAVADSPEVNVTNELHNGITMTITTTNQLISTGGILKEYADVHGGSVDNEYIQLSVLATYRNSDETVLLHAVKTNDP